MEAVQERRQQSKAPVTPAQELAVSVDRACQITGLSRASLYRLMACGELRYKQARGKRIIPVQAIQEFLGNDAL